MIESNTYIDIVNAYRKLKHYYYYDTTLQFIRKDIAEFESSPHFEEKLLQLTKAIEQPDEDSENFFNNLISQISYKVLPKSYKRTQGLDAKGIIVTNKVIEREKVVKDVSWYLSAPVELLILDVYWVVKVGHFIEKKVHKSNYANRLSIADNEDIRLPGLKLYRPYFKQYQNWRDKAIRKAKDLLDDDRDVAIVSLDIRKYYYSVRFDFSDILNLINDSQQYNFITNLVSRTYRKYTCIYYNKQGIADDGKSIIPIGLLSAGLIANWYLLEFDEKVEKQLNPIFYGRYVDDILVVIQNPQIDYEKGGEIIKDFLRRYFNSGLLAEEGDDFWIDVNGNKLCIQAEKVKLADLAGKGSKLMLEKFEKDLIKTSSEFKLLPDDQLINERFAEDAQTISYDESPNAFRNVKGFSISRYGASKYLAKMLFSSLIAKNEDVEKDSNNIMTLFEGVQGLELYLLWEKAFTFFVINDCEKHFINLFKSIHRSIDTLQKESIVLDSIDSIRTSFHNFLNISVATAVTLNPNFYKKRKVYNLLNERVKFNFEGAFVEYKSSNLLRHNYVNKPLLNYTTYSVNTELLSSLIAHKHPKKIHGSENFTLDDKLVKYSPRYVYLSETILHLIHDKIFSNDHVNEASANIRPHIDGTYLGEFAPFLYDKAFEAHFQINYEGLYSKEIQENTLQRVFLERIDDKTNFKDALKSSFFKIQVLSKPEDSIIAHQIKIPGSGKKEKIKIAVANYNVHEQNLKNSILGKSTFSYKRKEEVIHLLNTALRLKCDLVVLPENSVPFEWLPLFTLYARRNQIGIVCGLEHLNIYKTVFNYQAVILPFENQCFKDAFVSLRLKNHYSPHEHMVICDYGFHVPKNPKPRYELYKWRGVCFSTYNCYELADINHRAVFRSKVDFIVATEYNKDTEYFSSIVESATRDLHCYFVQVNSSSFGDSRITQPTKHYNKDILRLKGGENDTVLTAILDIEKLRDFQRKGYNQQKYADTYKPTPPDYDNFNADNRYK